MDRVLGRKNCAISGTKFGGEGIGTKLQIAVFLAGLAIVFARKPDALLNPQFFAEDGKIWFGDAYNSGWLQTLFTPYAGYLQTLPRLVAGLALVVPFRFAPLLMNFCGALVQVLPANLLLSNRCARWALLPVRVLMAAIYLLLPNARDIHITITNAQWHLAVLACISLLAFVPKTIPWRAFDAAVAALCGLTGPFCFVLAPIGFFFFGKRRQPWHLVLGGVMAICAAIQILTLLLSHPARFQDPLGASPQLFIRILAGDVYLGALLGRWAPLEFHVFFYAAVALIGTGLVLYAIVNASLEFRLFVVFVAAIFLASIATPITGQHAEPQWWHLRGSLGTRYWFLPTLAFLWCLVWCATAAASTFTRRAAICGAVILCIGVVADWRYPAYVDLHFPEYAKAFDAASPGTAVTIPLNPLKPEHWEVRLLKKSADRSQESEGGSQE